MSINLKTLIGKLNDTSRTAATRAASLCVSLGQYEVDIEHLFLALLDLFRSQPRTLGGFYRLLLEIKIEDVLVELDPHEPAGRP